MAKIDNLRTKKESEGFFYEYLTSKEVGTNVFNSFIKFYEPEQGFPLDDIYNKSCGTISNCMALSILLELDAMGVDISNFKDGFKFLVEDMFNRVYESDNKLMFDATPYISKEECNNAGIDTYIETVSKICIISLDLRSYSIRKIMQEKSMKNDLIILGKKITTYKELIRYAENLIIDSVNILVSSSLKIEDDIFDYQINGNKIVRNTFPQKVEYRGWAFQKPRDGECNSYETSLYFTYHATNAFISIYNELRIPFEDYISKTEISKDDENWRKYNDFDKSFFHDNKEILIEFRNITSSTGRYIDTILKKNGIDIAFDYIKGNFKKISAADIIDSPKNNYLIDTIFALAIMINAGIDEDYTSVGQLDYFYEQLLASITNVKKIYTSLKRDNREDLINTYRLMFNELCPLEYRRLLKKLRKNCENIAVYDFVPLLCNTYATIFNYLIQYPQKEMVDNLQLIMENCVESDEWYWDKNGFNINNNLYYIFAVENFYEYYKTYELPSSENGKKYNAAVEDIKKLLKDKEKDYKDLDERYENLKKDYDNKKSLLDTEVSRIAEKVFNEKIDESIFKYLQSMIEDSYSFILNAREFKNDIVKNFNNNEKVKLLYKISNAINITQVQQHSEGLVKKHAISISEFDKDVENSILIEIGGGN